MYNERIVRLRKAIEDPLLITFLPNIRYLTGFTGSSAFVYVSADRFVFITDGRYEELGTRLMASIDGGELVAYRTGLVDVLVEQFAGSDRVGLEAQDVNWSFVHGLKDKTQSALVPTRGVVEALREVKDEFEIAALGAAAAAGDRAFEDVRSLAATAGREGDLGWALINAMRDAGAQQAGWPPIAAAGANAALPHHLSDADPVGAGLLLLDYGCTVDGYHSDMSRTIWLQGEPDSETRRMHQAVHESQEAGIAAIRPGVTGRDVDEACRAVLRKYDYEDLFVHSTGHGVGLEIHEGPRLAASSDDVLVPGNVVTVEPGVYVPGFGGIRIEDMVVVTEDGHHVLTNSDKGLDA
ncbi:MAG: aminopeptidase P family protein [bacterium]|nr:aminopeptidase P family protein [bacterium]